MDLSLTRKGLQFFDASTLLLDPSEKSRETKNGVASRERYMPVRALDLSHNKITRFVGAQGLWSLTVLDLSNNALGVLDASSLPSGLSRLCVSHNALQGLRGLAAAAPKLQELDVSCNRITSSGMNDVPRSLTSVLCQSNLIDSVKPFLSLQHLSHLDLSSNQIENLDELRRLRGFRTLRHLELQGNPVMGDPDATATVLEMLPRLIQFDRVPLSQAGENQMYKVNRSRIAKGNVNGSQQTLNRSGSVSHRSISRRREVKSDADLEVELVEARVKELERLLGASKKMEHQLRDQRKILQEQVAACAGVIDSQAMELERLENEIKELREEEEALREPVAELEQTFVQTHASLVAHRLNRSAER